MRNAPGDILPEAGICIPIEVLRAYQQQSLAPGAVDYINKHLVKFGCLLCRDRLSKLNDITSYHEPAAAAGNMESEQPVINEWVN